MRLRDGGSLLGIFALLSLLAGLAWLTRNPDAEIVGRAERWPLAGPLAAWFRQAYRPRSMPEIPDRRPAGRDSRSPRAAARVEVVLVEPAPEDVGARPFVWVPPGTPIHAAPETASEILETVGALSNLSRLEQRGDWYRVRAPRAGRAPIRGWVRLVDYREPTRELLRQPEPVLPLPSSPPHPAVVADARRLMATHGTERRCGPHPVFTDDAGSAVLTVCPQLVSSLEAIYPRRYGVEPVGAAAEAILLFSRAEAYRAFRDAEEVRFEGNTAHAIPARGYLALFLENQALPEVLATLVHELAHLLNRRALGPALPPWLAEGISDELAESAIAADGTIHPGLLGGERVSDGFTVIRSGGLASVRILQEALAGDRLPVLRELVRLDADDFHRPERALLHYAASSFWVRYLVSGYDSARTAGFRSFLADVSRGRPLSEELLLERLAADWAELEMDFRTWLRLQYLLPRDEEPMPSRAAGAER